MDNFKTINDSLGHNMGDLFLQHVAKNINGCLREEDTVARIGGDEFVILLPDIKGEQGAIEVARRIEHTFTRPFHIDDVELFTSASIGISIYFASLMAGRFLGAILLRKLNTVTFFIISALVTLAGLVGILVSGNLMLTRILIFIAGLGFSNVFPIMFALTIEKMPDYANELSGLIILALSGGAIIPPLMGVLTDLYNVNAIIFVLVFCMLYVTFTAIYSLYMRRSAGQSSEQ